jgi:hypothetical protein
MQVGAEKCSTARRRNFNTSGDEPFFLKSDNDVAENATRPLFWAAIMP